MKRMVTDESADPDECRREDSDSCHDVLGAACRSTRPR